MAPRISTSGRCSRTARNLMLRIYGARMSPSLSRPDMWPQQT